MSTTKHPLNIIKNLVDAIDENTSQADIKLGLNTLIDSMLETIEADANKDSLDYDTMAKHFILLNPTANAVDARMKEGVVDMLKQFGKHLTRHIYDIQYVGPVSQKLLIDACKYGYDYHVNASFPEHTFEEEAINNFKQELTTWDLKPNLADQMRSLFEKDGDMYMFTKVGDRVEYEKIGDLVRTEPSNHIRMACINFLDSIREYEHESGQSIYLDDRNSETLYDIHIKKIPASSY